MTRFSEILDARPGELARPPRWSARERVVRSFDVAGDGRVAMVTTPDEELIHHEGWSRVDVWDPGTGEIDGRHPAKAGAPATRHPSAGSTRWQWSDDGELLAFSISFDGYPTCCTRRPAASGGWQLVELPSDPTGVHVTGGSLAWRPASHDLCFLGDDRARGPGCTRRPVCRAVAAPAARVLTPGDVTVDGLRLRSRPGDSAGHRHQHPHRPARYLPGRRADGGLTTADQGQPPGGHLEAAADPARAAGPPPTGRGRGHPRAAAGPRPPATARCRWWSSSTAVRPPTPSTDSATGSTAAP